MFRSPSLFFRKIKSDKTSYRFSEQFNFDIDPDKKIWQLSAGEQQRVEIIKALVNGASLLILDEPTSVLTPQETHDFFQNSGKNESSGADGHSHQPQTGRDKKNFVIG